MNEHPVQVIGAAHDADADYVLGSSDLEHRRLMLRGRILRSSTDRFLRLGGLRPGMSVLDLGSGMGDVSMLAGEIVGPRGRVLGIDRDPAATDKARRRARNEGFDASLDFEVTELDDFDTTERFDAVVGRYVLLYQKDPADLLRRFTRFLRPGGILVFHEVDFTVQNPSWPPSPLWDECYRLLSEVYRATGTPPDFGRRLNRTFLDAGLPAPEVECEAPVAAGGDSPIIPWLAYTLRSIAPALAKAGLSLPAGLVADDTLPDQLEKALLEQGSQVLGALQYGAWTRVP
ncbi:class I SAM-dependent methyltransferase [Streptomyces ipomoeae]|jgi:ubiquinone/menaquinone biosynthesis C-methylase UbiE|uniref:Class I SAM-dependent methyltransferase n=1 Tax=Streptomyces ipomoeae TaxID=103232 RepID=A0AAE8VZD4_9ACTN|nr:class I SAM-dependent methyltransferase [Streptomyces ipomoeae]MDX2693926.1 class I SAM-dependent methyltransferase [Streptomyces ipomoeae]MDX2823517.1 class I SAM-dependent methyltransferase [Streptomyces ipomoeae]MDX2839832.1 class I SAM-dependent methyltransferase [Streptomyces ipomoeae]MDX2876077.1 class I SAM-dependent methyltransferase [Streptomyces ipomoeae]TQE28939.1 class I SAM-dependent methyltransferase [Streptomyces ipomoeae]